MTNLIRVFNLTTNKTRIYRLPDDVNIAKATLVSIPFGTSTALGLAASDSWTVNEQELQNIRIALGIDANGTFKLVRSVYTETPIKDDSAADSDADAVQAEETSNTAEN